MVLEYVKFPLIMNHECTGKDESFIHFMTEYVDGSPFGDVLMELEILEDEQTKFYVGQIVLMLQYLHHHGIVYRDLKPDNIICGTDVRASLKPSTHLS